MKTKVLSEGTFYDWFHVRCWSISESAALAARPERLDGWENHAITAMTFAFLTVESYCNYVIQVLDPVVWQQEKQHFSGRNGGVMGKIDHVMKLVNVSMARSARPMKTIVMLKHFRDKIAHGRYETRSTSEIHDHDQLLPLPNAEWRQMLLPKEEKLSLLPDVETFVQTLHIGYLSEVKVRVRARKMSHTMWQQPSALRGTFSSHVVSTGLLPVDLITNCLRALAGIDGISAEDVHRNISGSRVSLDSVQKILALMVKEKVVFRVKKGFYRLRT